MIIFLDSSILCSDYYQKSTNFELLKHYLSKGSFLHLSQIVVDEVMNKYKEEIISQVSKINSEHKALNNRISKPIESISDDFVQSEIKSYSDFLERFFMEYSVSVEDYPSASHREVVQRALERKKPFKEDGKTGYRDYLIWKTLLQIIKSYTMEQIGFITSNTRDFSDAIDKNVLHSDLQNDIKSLNIDMKRFHYFTSLKDFIEKQVKPKLKQIEERENLIKSLLADKTGFIASLENSLIEKLQGMDISDYGISGIPEGENPSIDGVEEVSSVEILDVSEVSSNEYLLQIKARVLCNTQFFIFKSDLVVMDDINEINIVDSDWNKHYVLAETSVELNISMEVIYEKNNEKVQSIDISEVENPDNDCIYCN